MTAHGLCRCPACRAPELSIVERPATAELVAAALVAVAGLADTVTGDPLMAARAVALRRVAFELRDLHGLPQPTSQTSPTDDTGSPVGDEDYGPLPLPRSV